MEAEQQIIKASKRKDNFKKGAKISLTVLLLYVVGQLATVYQTRSQVVSPIIPESVIWEINKQFIFTAFVSAIISVVGLILYFFDKYLLVIVLVVLTLIANRFIYIQLANWTITIALSFAGAKYQPYRVNSLDIYLKDFPYQYKYTQWLYSK